MPIAGLTENHERSLVASVRYAAQLIRDGGQVLRDAEHPDRLSRYGKGLTPPQRTIVGDYLLRLRQYLIADVDTLAINPGGQPIDPVSALSSILIFLDDTFEQMRGPYLLGYGNVSPEAAQLLDGVASQLQALAREAQDYLLGGSDADLEARVRRLPEADAVTADIRALASLIEEHGLIDFRAALSALVERAGDPAFEVAMVGRVSSGKSSLLNALVGVPLLPTGVLPVTAFPTRVRRGAEAVLAVTDAAGRTTRHQVAEIAQFVTESQNPGNQKRLTRLVLEYPSDRLPEGITFVDTPGLWSVMGRSALQTLAYLPRCDHATYLLDATAPLSDDDIDLLRYLHDAGIGTTVLLSKADLLSEMDLARVLAYVREQLDEPIGGGLAVHPVSALRSHAAQLEAWVASDIRPLSQHAHERGRELLRGKVTLLRQQVDAALRSDRAVLPEYEQPEGFADTMGAQVREISARVERLSREARALPERREDLVRVALAAAATALANLQDGDATPVREALRQPSQALAEGVSSKLRTLADHANATLTTLAQAVNTPAPTIDAGTFGRDLPLLDLPPLPSDAAPPFWTGAHSHLRTNWFQRWIDARWKEPVDRALAAHLDVLAHWARESAGTLGSAFDSQSRPLLMQLSSRPRTEPTRHSGATDDLDRSHHRA